MGDYLLKGYKMLATSCDECSTILLEDKSGMKYCIACKELDTDTEKDNPVTSAIAARSLVQEGSSITNGKSAIPQFSRLDLYSSPSSGEPPTVTMAITNDHIQSESPITSLGGLTPELQSEAVSTLCSKISWACEQLKVSTSVDHCIGLCNLIKASTDALQSLKVYNLQK
ncbi:hypothetical protein FSP39_016846 [Pinctada imbricata]|uniref:Sjoegren syndrome/scleroderma autoantigen 1 n=1 Tax=Pinctada imbricata TaxID=66713 RepID=A0AA88Y0I0_PINIB|nr:hypothetical protein FSP39_016846 [Pinctada imbricata]